MSKDNETAPVDLIELKSEVRSGFSAIEQQMKTIFGTLEKLDRTLNGNGHPGIVEKVAKLEERLQGTWKTLIILGWLANFAVAAAAFVASIIK